MGKGSKYLTKASGISQSRNPRWEREVNTVHVHVCHKSRNPRSKREVNILQKLESYIRKSSKYFSKAGIPDGKREVNISQRQESQMGKRSKYFTRAGKQANKGINQ